MTELFFMNTCNASTSSLWAWQKEVYRAAERWEHHLFTEDGIKELVAKLQKMADGLKGKDREVRLYKYTHDDSPNIAIGPGSHSACISFTKVEGTGAPMVEKVEAVRGEVVSISHESGSSIITDIVLRFYDSIPMAVISGKDVLVTMEEVEQ